MKVIRILVLLLVASIITSCSYVSSEQNIEEVVTDTSTPIEPTWTIEPTVTAMVEPTVEPTKEPAFYEKNWGNYAKTLEAADVEKNGVIIPYNPIDNPEEFFEAVNEIFKEKGGDDGSEMGMVVSEGGKLYRNPSSESVRIEGKIEVPFQIMYFKYGERYYAFIMTDRSLEGWKPSLLLTSDLGYEPFVGVNKKGSMVNFETYNNPENQIFDKYVGWGVLDLEMREMCRKTGMHLINMGKLH
jgi:hypothetical protein